MNKLFKLGPITEKTMGQPALHWSEVDNTSCTTTNSPKNSGRPC